MVFSPPIDKEILHNLYILHKNIHKVGKILNVSGDTISRWLKTYGIEIIGRPDKYQYIRDIPLNGYQREFIIGSMLGDGNIDNSRNGARIRFCHGPKQLEYLEWKKNILGALVQQKIHKGKPQVTRNNTYTYSLQSIQHPEFLEYHKLFYNGNKKIIPTNIEELLTPLGIAVWYMDDGSAKKDHRSALFCTDSFTEEENLMIVAGFEKKFKIHTALRKSSNRIVIYGDEVDKLFNIITQYIIPSMVYKIPKY